MRRQPQRPETAIAHITVYKCGMVVVPLFTLFGSDALEYRLADSGARALITDTANLEKVAAVRDRLPQLAALILVDGAGTEAGPAIDLRQALDQASDRFAPEDTAPDDPALIIYTSGMPCRRRASGGRAAVGGAQGIFGKVELRTYRKLKGITTTDTKMALLELVQKSDDGNFLRELLQFSLQRLMSFEVDGLCGAGPHERSEGARQPAQWLPRADLRDTAGNIGPAHPQAAAGQLLSNLPEARKTAERPLVAVIQEAWIHGVSTRKVDDLVQALGMSGISKSQISELGGRSTSGSTPSSIGHSRANGPIYGLMPPTSRCARAAG